MEFNNAESQIINMTNSLSNHKSFSSKLISTFIIIAAAILTATFTSCESTSQESKSNTTYVNTKASFDGKLYSIMVFEKLTSVQARILNKNTVYEIPLKDCKYNSETTVLDITLPDNIPYKKSELIFSITGVAKFPAEFILANGQKSKLKPGIFLNGKLAKENVDYTFDTKTAHLVFISKVDADKDSYEINWITPYGTNAMSNKTEKLANEYKLLRNEWYRNIK